MTPNPSTRNLQRRLQICFSKTSIHRGEDYFYHKAVMAVRVGQSGANAEVVGTEIYPVSIEWTKAMHGMMSANCTCPHFTEGYMCKHLWAFILQLDELGVPPIQISRLQLELVFGKRFEVPESQVPGEATHPKLQLVKSAPQLANWRQAFMNPPKPKKDRSLWRSGQEVFVVLELSEREENMVQFRFFMTEQNTGGVLRVPRPLTLPQNGDLRHPDAKLQSVLKTIATLSLGELARQDRYHSYRYYADPSTRTLELSSVRAVLPSLLETGKVFATKNDFIKSHQTNEDLSLKPVSFGSLTLKVTDLEQGNSLSAVLEFKTDASGATPTSEMVAARELNLIASPNLYSKGNHVGFVDLTEREESWFNELSGGDLNIPPEDGEAFLEAILNQQVKVELPASLNWEPTVVNPAPKLDLLSDKETGRDRYIVDLKFQYGSRIVSSWNPISELPSIDDKRIYSRNRVEEGRVYSLLPIHLLSRRREDDAPSIHAQSLHEFVKAALAAGIPVTVESKKVQEANDFQISVSSGVDWFDVDGQAGFSGRWVKFPSILEAISRGESFIPLPDGSIGLITEQMTKRLEKLAVFADKGNGNLRFSSAQGLILNSLLENEKNLNLDAKFAALREKIKSFSGIKPSDPVPGFKGKLRKYQREGLGWLEFLNAFGLGGILADDMGLGKTIQCLAFVEARRTRSKWPSLLIAPKSVLENWQMEAKRFTPGMDVLIYAGLNRDGSESLFKKHDLIVTTYQTMLRDIELLKEIKWDCVIVDEAQAIKNPEALISKAAKLLPAQFRLAMTGTPIENSVQDLFSISDFVNPGFLNGKRRSAHLKLSDETRKALSRAFKPVVLRRTKDQVLKDLPEKTEQLISVELEPKQRKVYNELKRFYQSQLMEEVKEKGIKKSQIQILAALTRLRQVALHPGLVDPAHAKTRSSKFEVMLEMLEEVIAEGHRVLIFSQFTTLLGLLKTELKQRKIEFCYLDGKTSKRQEVVNDFKESACPVFLMSLKAGGVGLNLVEADYVFLLDPWWNPAVEAQAIDRVHRIGQKRAVNAYRFIAKNTVEEKILELQQTKRGLSEEILGQKSGPMRSLTAQDIESLFS